VARVTERWLFGGCSSGSDRQVATGDTNGSGVKCYHQDS
jgi:hypothetical protein